MSYELVYDAASAGFAGWQFVGIGVILTSVGALLLFIPKLRSIFGNTHPRFLGSWFYWVFFLFGLFWTLAASMSIYSGNRTVAEASASGECKIVVGQVENFEPMPHSGHQLEKFTVNDIAFAYSDFVITGAYNNTTSHGGPIKEGLQVRICYVERNQQDSNLIARLEVAK